VALMITETAKGEEGQ